MLTEHMTVAQRDEFDALAGLNPPPEVLQGPDVPQAIRGKTPPAWWLAAERDGAAWGARVTSPRGG